MVKNTNTTQVSTATNASTNVVAVITCPANRPTAGGLVFAWTYACLRVIKTLPKGKQASVAHHLHGSTMLKHHGINGTQKAVVNDDGSMTYDIGFFAIGSKNKSDPKRAKVSEHVSDNMLHYIQTGLTYIMKGNDKVELDLGGWKPNTKPLAVISVTK